MYTRILTHLHTHTHVHRFRLEAKTPNGDILTPDLIEVSTMGMGDELTPTASYFFTSNIEGNLGTWTIVVHESGMFVCVCVYVDT
jgi:hypothetical protein